MTDANVGVDGDGGKTSLSLLERVRAHDQAAWARLVEVYDPLLQRWCARAGLQPADAADLKQDVFAAVARTIGAFRRDRPGDTFRGWLYTITRNKLRDRARKADVPAVGGSDAQAVIASLPDQEPAEDAGDDRTLYLRAIEAIRGEFEPRSWDAFWRVTVDGRGAADVAAELRTTANAVYLARSRILRRLREEFDGLLHADTVPATPRAPEGE